MAYLDAADMLARMQAGLNRPATDEVWGASNATAYLFLTESQDEVMQFALPRAPGAFIGSPIALTPSTDRKTWTFGTDADNDDKWPMAHATIYPTLASYPDSPWVEGIDYLLEGDLVRIPGNRAYSGTLYASFAVLPNVLNASNAPVCPKPLRLAVVALAKARFAEQVLKQDSLPYLAEYESRLTDGLVALRNAVRLQGARKRLLLDWTRSPDLSSHGGG